MSASPQLLMILVMGGLHAAHARHDPELDRVTKFGRRDWSLRYFGLCAFLGACAVLADPLVRRTAPDAARDGH
jgi:hypothetical protein